MQTWILIIGGLVVLGIGLDLLRRMRNASRTSQEMDFNMQQGVREEDPLSTPRTAARKATSPRDPDFPNGGARKISRGAEQTGPVPPSGNGPRVEPRIKTQAPLEDTQKIDPQKMRRAPTVPAESAAPLPPKAPPAPAGKDPETDTPIPMLMDTAEKVEASFSDDDDPFMSGRSPILSKPRVVPRKPAEEQAPEPEEVIIIHVMARAPERLAGARLLETLIASGLRYGEMNVFHYHVSDTDDTALFSMVNMVKPGTFDLNNMQSFETPGVSLFMRLPLKTGEKISAMETFDKMLGCAKKLAQNLNAELRDSQRSVMTGQTIEHCRQRISEFSRRTLSRSGKYTHQ